MEKLNYFQVKVSCMYPENWIIYVERDEDDDESKGYRFSIRYSSPVRKTNIGFGSFTNENLEEGIELAQKFIILVETEVPNDVLNGELNDVYTCWSSVIPGLPFIQRKLILDTISLIGNAIFRYEYSVSEIDKDIIGNNGSNALFENNKMIGIFDANDMTIEGFYSAISSILNNAKYKK